MWASFRNFELLLQTFVLELNHTYVTRKQKRERIQAEPEGMCSKISANINRTYLFIYLQFLSVSSISSNNQETFQAQPAPDIISAYPNVYFFPSFPAQINHSRI